MPGERVVRLGTAKGRRPMDETLPSRRALIVDDEFLIALDLESLMRELGFDACTVVSQQDGSATCVACPSFL